MADGIYTADRERLAALLAQTSSMTRLVENIRTISLAEVGGLELRLVAADVMPLLDEVVMAHEEAARLTGVRLGAEPASQAIVARFDPAAMRRVLANVVSNAIRHTPPGGQVVLEAEDVSGDGRISIIVRDTGAGIPAELVPRVFDRFVKGDSSTGSGLGLAIARDLLDAMGGSIDLTSREGSGTTVTIRLPAGTSRDTG
jgi:two-component system sensor histidine kinase BaeS